jgi:hypothetical protein
VFAACINRERLSGVKSSRLLTATKHAAILTSKSISFSASLASNGRRSRGARCASCTPRGNNSAVVIQLARTRTGAYVLPDDKKGRVYLPFSALDDGQQVHIGQRLNYVLGIKRGGRTEQVQAHPLVHSSRITKGDRT